MALSKPSCCEDVMESDDCDNVEVRSVEDGDDVDMMNMNPSPAVWNQILSALEGLANLQTSVASEQAVIRTQLGSIAAESVESRRTQTTIQNRLEMMAAELSELQHVHTSNVARLQTPRIDDLDNRIVKISKKKDCSSAALDPTNFSKVFSRDYHSRLPDPSHFCHR